MTVIVQGAVDSTLLDATMHEQNASELHVVVTPCSDTRVACCILPLYICRPLTSFVHTHKETYSRGSYLALVG